MEKCAICDENKHEGIHLYTLFICAQCEYNIIHTEVREEKYRYYVEKLKMMNQPTLYS